MSRTKQIESRRSFLKRAAVAAITTPFIVGCKTIKADASDELSLIKANANTSPDINWCGAKDAPDNVSWKTVLSKTSDKDEPLIVSGTVFQPDGKTRAPNILIYFYHTDSEGYYGRGNGEQRHGHFRGWMLTDANGGYEFTTIKPAPYPNRTDPAHVHFTLTGKNFKEDWIDSIWFDGDKFITPEKIKQLTGRGGFNPIVKLKRDARGILRGTRNIQLWQI